MVTVYGTIKLKHVNVPLISLLKIVRAMKKTIFGNHKNIREKHIIGNQTRERIVYGDSCSAMAEIGMVMAGISVAPLGFEFARYAPKNFQFLGCLAGQGEVCIAEKAFICTTNQAYITPVAGPHAYRATRKKPWQVCWVAYKPNLWREQLEYPQPILCEAQIKPIHAAISYLHLEAVGPADAALLRHWILLIDQLVKRVCESVQQPSRLWKLWQMVDAELSRTWDNQMLAELACVSCEHLRRLCQQEIGHAPMQQVTKLRMERAKYLLMATPIKIAQIALLVGYDNAFAFSTAFKRYFELSPSHFRQYHQQTR